MPALSLASLAPGITLTQHRALRYIMRPQGGSVVGIAGGKRCGKSVLACATAVGLATLNDTPQNQIVLAMDTYSRLRDVHLPILSQLARSEGMEWKAGDHEFRCSGGAVIRLRHLEVSGSPLAGNPLEGQSLTAIVGDELQEAHKDYGTIFRERLSEALPSTIIGRDGIPRQVLRAPTLLMIGLPQREWWMSLARDQGGLVLRPQTRENAQNLRPGYEAELRASMTERYARSMLDGESWTPEGQVLYGFSAATYPDGNVLRGFALDFRRMRTMLAGDLGARSPAFLLMVEVLPRVWCVVREWAPDNTALPELCDMMAADVCPRRDWTPGDPRLPVDELVVDPAGAAMNDQTGHPDLEFLARPQPSGLGLWPLVEPQGPRRGVVAGLTRMNVCLEKRMLLMSGRVYDAGLAAPNGARTLVRSIQGYEWDPRNPGRPHKPHHDRVTHHIDAWRYGWRRVAWDAFEAPADEGSVRVSLVDTPASTWEAARDAR